MDYTLIAIKSQKEHKNAEWKTFLSVFISIAKLEFSTNRPMKTCNLYI